MIRPRGGGWPLLAASHPGPTLVVTLVTVGLSISAAAPLPRAVLIVAAVLAGQLSIGWSNDWIDAVQGRDTARADKPIATEHLTAGAVRTAAVVAAVVCVGLSALLGTQALALHLVAVAGGWVYNAWAKSTVLSVAPYLVSFGLLPAVVSSALGQGLASWWAILTGAMFGAGVHFANVLPDLEQDARTGVAGLPQRLGATGSVIAAVAFLSAGAATVLLAAPELHRDVRVVGAVVCALCLAAVAVAGRDAHYTAAFRLAMVTALVVVGLLVLS